MDIANASASDFISEMDRIADWISRHTDKLRECIPTTASGKEIDKVKVCISNLEQVINPVSDLCDWLSRYKPHLYNPVERRLHAVAKSVDKAKDSLPSLRKDPSIWEKTNDHLIDLNNAFAQLNKAMYYTRKEVEVAPQKRAGPGNQTSKRSKGGDIEKLFRFTKAQAFFNGKDLKLPTGAEVKPVEILKKLVKSFGKVVSYGDLDENSGNKASDFLRGKIRTIRCALEKNKVPCKIESKKWTGYILSNSRPHS